MRSLQNREHTAEFFVREISRRMETAGDGGPCAFIVLSAPMEFENDIARPSAPQGNRNCRVFYVRYSWVIDTWRRQRNNPRGFGRPFPPPAAPPLDRTYDSLEPLLKPLDPHLFQVSNAMEFRKALATILGEISRW